MTLNMFHKTGGGSAGLQGVPRMIELLSYSKNIQMPYMYIYLKPEFNQDKLIAQKIVSHLKYTIIKDLIKQIDIIYLLVLPFAILSRFNSFICFCTFLVIPLRL